ncbi:DUF4233 domain-containing protein [Curtobacterium caseinilyticum]|uniref:DUF4233 domain-containing protein n=1 Tax=Curtobacterium caseinilyticum TaxID=3055137 RepID=A0ABT7TS46_9MICO|nr:DUF4233 domain-containing protein [Curtobacterium caseinilyticum]MDM7892435.1 DUF4233 domain-containing protein [Curtobacterium caseinilyticum]
MTDAPRASRPGRQPRTRKPRPQRGARESLLSITLGLEAVMFFFPMLVVYGKGTLPPLAAFGGGILAIIVLAAASRLTGGHAGVWFGWLLQAAILATGFIEPFMFAVGAVFLALWVFCFVKGGQLDRQNAAFRAAQAED